MNVRRSNWIASRAFVVDDPSATLTRTGLELSIVGTIPYMSPLHVSGAGRGVR